MLIKQNVSILLKNSVLFEFHKLLASSTYINLEEEKKTLAKIFDNERIKHDKRGETFSGLKLKDVIRLMRYEEKTWNT